MILKCVPDQIAYGGVPLAAWREQRSLYIGTPHERQMGMSLRHWGEVHLKERGHLDDVACGHDDDDVGEEEIEHEGYACDIDEHVIGEVVDDDVLGVVLVQHVPDEDDGLSAASPQEDEDASYRVPDGGEDEIEESDHHEGQIGRCA